MFEYIILNAPRVMDALMEMEIRAMKGGGGTEGQTREVGA
jgi:hypothetical protein